MIVTRRLILSKHEMGNAEKLFIWRNDPQLAYLSSDSPVVRTDLENSRNKIKAWNDCGEDQKHFAIYRREKMEFIGYCHIVMIDPLNSNCRIGIVIGDAENWGFGYGKEIMLSLMNHCFDDLGLRRITCETYAHNERSWRMLETVGFKREGTLRENLRRGDKWVDEYVYGVLAHEE